MRQIERDTVRALVAIGNGYITLSTAKDYTIECDVQGSKVGDDLPDMGIVANRYTLILAGNLQKLRLVSWDALPRVDKTVQYDWKPDTWYRMKLTTEMQAGKGVIRGKAWPADQQEPAEWTVELTDSLPIPEGSAALYGYVQGVLDKRPGTEIYYDNLRITPNKAVGADKDIPNVKAPAKGADLAPLQIVGAEPMFAARPLFPRLWRLRR